MEEIKPDNVNHPAHYEVGGYECENSNDGNVRYDEAKTYDEIRALIDSDIGVFPIKIGFDAIVKVCNGLHSSDFKELNSRMFDGIHYLLIEHLPEFKDLLRNDAIEMLLTEGY